MLMKMAGFDKQDDLSIQTDPPQTKSNQRLVLLSIFFNVIFVHLSLHFMSKRKKRKSCTNNGK